MNRCTEQRISPEGCGGCKFHGKCILEYIYGTGAEVEAAEDRINIVIDAALDNPTMTRRDVIKLLDKTLNAKDKLYLTFKMIDTGFKHALDSEREDAHRNTMFN